MNRQKGAVVLLLALVMLVLLAFAGLAIDIGYMAVQKNRLQNVADAAALACVVRNSSSACGVHSTSLIDIPNNTNASIAALNLPSGANFNIETKYGNDTLTCLNASRQKNCAIAIASTTYDTFLMGALGSPSVSLSATARAGILTSVPCVLGLAISTSGTALTFTNGGDFLATCTLASNSGIIDNSGGTVTSTTGVIAYGSVPSTITAPSRLSFQSPTADPYAYLGDASHPAPTVATTCESTALANRANVTLNPGTYCNGLDINPSSGTTTLAPGVYVIAGGTLNLHGSGSSTSIVGSGVTFYIAGPNIQSSSGGKINASSSAGNVSLTAPTSGPLTGILIWQDATNGNADSISASGLMTLDGAIYAPAGQFRTSNSNAGVSVGFLLAHDVIITGGGPFKVTGSFAGSSASATPLYPVLLQ